MDYFNQESERLIYRKLTKEDIPSWVEFFIDNDRLMYLGMDLSMSKEELARDWILSQFDRYEKYGFGHLAVELKNGGDFIGLGGIIHRELNGETEREIAYSLKPSYWGKGYATEIATTLRHFGNKNINTKRFISIIDVNNKESAHVARKNGMKVLFKTEYLGMNVEVFGIDNT